MSTSRFTEKYDCFLNYSKTNNFFLFPKLIMNQVKTSGKMLIVDRIMSIFL